MARLAKRTSPSAVGMAGLLMTGMLSAIGAAAQDHSLLDSDLPEAEETGPHDLGEYAGVKPGGEQLPAIPATPGARPAAITWPGFQMRPDGSSRVFLQTTVPLTTQTENTGDQVIVELGAAQIAGQTNALPLDTRFFNTPVTKIHLKRVKGRVQLVLTMRAPATPTVTSERAASGFHFLYIDFPAGSYTATPLGPDAPPAPDEPPAAKPKAQPKKASQRNAPSHLDDLDNELPPGMGKVKKPKKAKAGASAGGQVRAGGAGKGAATGGNVEGKAGFSL